MGFKLLQFAKKYNTYPLNYNVFLNYAKSGQIFGVSNNHTKLTKSNNCVKIK